MGLQQKAQANSYDDDYEVVYMYLLLCLCNYDDFFWNSKQVTLHIEHKTSYLSTFTYIEIHLYTISNQISEF